LTSFYAKLKHIALLIFLHGYRHQKIWELRIILNHIPDCKLSIMGNQEKYKEKL